MMLVRILLRVVVYEFYKINSGFFFLLFCLLVATVHHPEQMFTYPFLAKVAESEIFVLIFLVISGLYARKCLIFFLTEVSAIRNTFMYYLPLVGRRPLAISISVTLLMLLLPVLLYGLLVTIVAVKIGKWTTIAAIILFFFLTLLFISRGLIIAMSRTVKEYAGGLRISSLGNSRLYYSYFVNYILNEKKLTFISTKVLSVLTLVGIMKLYFSDEYPERLIYLGMLVSMMFHFVLAFDLRRFEERYLTMLRNLPMRGTVYAVYALVYFLIVLPEVTVAGFYVTPWQLLFMLVFGVSVLLSLHVTAYFSAARMKLFFRNSLIVFFLLFFSLLFRTPVPVVSALLLATSYVIFHLNYFDRDISVLQ